MGLPVEVNNLLLGGARAYTIGRSLRFRSSASAYLNRTPASAGNRQTWTWSAWVKRGTLGSSLSNYFLSAFDGGGKAFYIGFVNDVLDIHQYDSGANVYYLLTSAVYRDPSAWYHIVVAMDTTQATASNRLKLYVNGTQVTAFTTATYGSQNYSTTINQNVGHLISAGYNGSTPQWNLDGYLAEVNLIDGQALTPSSFGETDLNGIWQPKKYAGTYGTNGFYLPFSAGYNTSTTYAGSFNGSNQFLSVASSASLAPSTGDFTVEANVNFNALPSSSGYAAIFENQIATTSATSDKFYLALKNNAGTYRIEMGQHSTANVAYVNWTPTVGTWYHVALVRQSGTTLIFINGVQQTVTNSTVFNGTSFGQNGASIGAISTPFYLNGYISNARYVVGTAVYTTGFTPPSANLTAVTNTQLLTLQGSTIVDNSSAARTITNNGTVTVSQQYAFQYTLASVGSDYSGNSNNWTLNNINATILGTTYDSMIDSPTVSITASNYAVLNAIKLTDPGASATAEISQGNLAVINTRAANNVEYVVSTIGVTSGKWYYEATMGGNPSPGLQWIGINTSDYGSGAYIRGYRNDNGQYYNGSAWSSYGATYASGDVIGIAFDLTSQTIEFFKNGTSQGQKTSIGVSGQVLHAAAAITQGSGAFYFNFGQRPFSYTPPSGYKALNTYNLPAPSIANGAQYMAATTYTANGTTQNISNAVNGVSFQPDLVWQKRRNSAGSHYLADSLRGTSKLLSSDTTAAEATNTTFLTSFNSGGWSQGTGNYTNGESIVGWQWKGGGTGVTNTSGTITSTVSANPSAGFSIATYSGNGTNGATVGHGLGVKPDMIIIKGRNASTGSSQWICQHVSLSGGVTANSSTFTLSGYTQAIYLNLTNAAASYAFDAQVNGASGTYVAYCFSAVRGYSAFGSYTGNGSADGPFIYTGFRPRFIMIKNATAINNWGIIDTSRDAYNGAFTRLHPNLSQADNTGAGVVIDVLSNGFKCRNSDALENQSGQTIIYAAFAEHPFNYSRAR
jgi:hypothetical protein